MLGGFRFSFGRQNKHPVAAESNLGVWPHAFAKATTGFLFLFLIRI